MPTLPVGLYFSRYSKVIQCTICRTPWDAPVEMKPCGHVFCAECVGTAPVECPLCSMKIEKIQRPTQALVDLVSEVYVMCEHCDWAGSRVQSKAHMCRGRQQHLCMQALRVNPDDRNAWFGLAVAIKAGDVADFDGAEVTKVTCYRRCVELASDEPSCWTNLGAALPPTTTVEIGGAVVTKSGCYIRALEIDNKCVGAWFNLGNAMEPGDVVHIMGNPVFKDTCYIRSVEIDNRFAAGWFNLGLSVEPGFVVDYKGIEMGKKELFREAVIAKDLFAPAWNALGMSLKPGKDVKMPQNKRYSKKECFAKAVSIDPGLHEAWYNLYSVMKPDEYAEVDGLQYTKSECRRKSGQRDKDTDRGSTETPRSQSSARSSRSRNSSRGKDEGCIIS